MSLIKNFDQFVNENLSQKFKVFEDINIDDSNGYPANSLVTAEFEQWLSTPSAAQFRTFAAMQQAGSRNKLSSADNQASVLFALLKRGQATKKGFLGIGSITDTDLAKKGFEELKAGTKTLTMTQAMAEYVPTTSSSFAAKTAGKVYTEDQLLTDPKYNQAASDIRNVVAFVNQYNTGAFAKGQAQYVISKRLREDGYLDFLAAADVVDNTNLFLYAYKIKGTEVASKELTPKEVGGEPASTGKYGAEFAAGSAEINPSVQAEVDKAADFVISKFPAGKVPDKFQLTSGASTEWNKKNYPQTSGSGAVANPTSDEQKNQDLAYRRGVAFANALNAKLKEKGHPGIDGYVVNWAIGKSGQQANPADRFIDLEIEKNAKAPVKQTAMAVSTTGSKAVSYATTKGQIYEFKLSIA